MRPSEAKESQNLETVLIIGPTPPPAHGISVLTDILLRSDLKQSFEVVHLDTADRRTLDNVGRFEFHNVLLALYHGARFHWLLLSKRPAVVYMPVSESVPGFLRDCLFLLPSRLWGIPVVLHLHGGHLDTLYARARRYVSVADAFLFWTRCPRHRSQQQLPGEIRRAGRG